ALRLFFVDAHAEVVAADADRRDLERTDAAEFHPPSLPENRLRRLAPVVKLPQFSVQTRRLLEVMTGACDHDGARVARLPGPPRRLTRRSDLRARRVPDDSRCGRYSLVARRAWTRPASFAGFVPVPQLRTRRSRFRPRHRS